MNRDESQRELVGKGKAIERLNDLLSEQTRGWMNDFIEEHFGMPPEFCDSRKISLGLKA